MKYFDLNPLLKHNGSHVDGTGTLITNFSRSSLEKYATSIKDAGLQNKLVISAFGYNVNGEDCGLCSLHALGERLCLSEFWRYFDAKK